MSGNSLAVVRPTENRLVRTEKSNPRSGTRGRTGPSANYQPSDRYQEQRPREPQQTRTPAYEIRSEAEPQIHTLVSDRNAPRTTHDVLSHSYGRFALASFFNDGGLPRRFFFAEELAIPWFPLPSPACDTLAQAKREEREAHTKNQTREANQVTADVLDAKKKIEHGKEVLRTYPTL